MASPFRAFRKHQKAMIAILALLAMVAFVVLPIVLQNMGMQPVQNPTVVTTDRYGDIDRQRLSNMVTSHRVLGRFFSEIGGAIYQASGDPYRAQQYAMQIANFLGPVNEQSVVDTWLLARRAEELGLVVSDSTVNEFLRDMTTARGVTANQVKQILAGMKLSQGELFALLKEVLLARQFRELFLVSLGGTTPAERWEYYRRLNRKVTIEAMPVPMSEFIDQVPDPDEATLQAFFEKHKEEPFVPGSPEPGFLVPQKIAVEYFKADYDRLDEIVEVTDAEMAAYYEENKDEVYRREELPEIEPKEATEKPTEKKAAEKKKPEGKKPAEKSTKEKPAEGAGDSAGPDEKTSGLEGGSVFRLASLAEDKPVEEPATDESTPAAEEKPAPAEKPAAEPVEYVPLEEVADEIRKRLADEKIEDVLNRLRDEMTRYQNEWIVYDSLPDEEKQAEEPPEKLDMTAAAEAYRLSAHVTEPISAYEAAELDIGDSTVEGNAPFTTYAYETLPKYRPAMSQDDEGNYYLFWKVSDTEARVPEWDDRQVRAKVLRAWKAIQARDLAKAEAERLAEVARQSDESLAETFGGDPDKEVVHSEPFSWLTYGAVSPMMARQPPRISEIKARVKDPETGEETEQDAVEMPGKEFMRAVFHLEKGELGVAMNQPKTTAYVVRVTDVNPLPEVLWRLFISDDFVSYGLAGQSDQAAIVTAWREQIKEAAGFEWKIEPEELSGR